jgi:hypothetical protein
MLGLSVPATCTGGPGNLTINPNGSPVALGDVSVSGGAQLTLVGESPAATYNINSLTFTGNSQLTISSGAVKVNIAGKDSGGDWLPTPVDLTGGTVTNACMPVPRRSR